MRTASRAYGVDAPGANASPFDAVLAQVVGLPRRLLERLVQHAIDWLDEDDGDPDLELNGDQLDGTGAEDELTGQLWNYRSAGGAGCLISDPDC